MSRVNEFSPNDLTYGEDTPQVRQRLRELILFVAERCENDTNFGLTKLNKILFYCDFMAFAKLGGPITGIPYNKLQFGPAPTAAQITRDQMMHDGDIAVTKEGHVSFRRSRVVALREADLDIFTGSQVALIDSVIDALGGVNAKALSEVTHGNAWKSVRYNDKIPYEAAFISDEPYTENDIDRAHELVAFGDLKD